MKLNKISFIRIIALLLIFACFTGLFGCRPSSVLQQIVYTKDGRVDTEKQKTDNNENNTEEDEKLSSKKDKDDASKETDFENSIAKKGNNDSDSFADDEDITDLNVQNKTDITETTTQTQNTDPTLEDVYGIIPTKDPNSLRKVVDGSNMPVDVPKNVENVCANDIVALYVELLGGKNRIVASSKSFLSNRYTTTVFGSDEINGIKALWPDTGTSIISDFNFKELVSLRPDVCFTISGQAMFSDEQLEVLNTYGIYVVTLPKFNTTDSIIKALSIIAEVLGDKSSVLGQKNAETIKTKYISWYENLLSDVASKGRGFAGSEKTDFDFDRKRTDSPRTNDSLNDNGYYTLLVTDWNTSVTYSARTDVTTLFSGTGMAETKLGYATDTPVSYYMSLGGACNTAALLDDPTRKTVLTRYLSPLEPSVISTNNNANWNKSQNKQILSSLGTAGFNKVIVTSNAAASYMAADMASANGLWKFYPLAVFSGTQGNYNLNFTDVAPISSLIKGTYSIVVNPSGVGEWINGSPESPLECIWINSVFYGDYSTGDLRTKIIDFYREFYDYDASGIADGIISGK